MHPLVSTDFAKCVTSLSNALRKASSATPSSSSSASPASSLPEESPIAFRAIDLPSTWIKDLDFTKLLLLQQQQQQSNHAHGSAKFVTSFQSLMCLADSPSSAVCATLLPSSQQSTPMYYLPHRLSRPTPLSSSTSTCTTCQSAFLNQSSSPSSPPPSLSSSRDEAEAVRAATAAGLPPNTLAAMTMKVLSPSGPSVTVPSSSPTSSSSSSSSFPPSARLVERRRQVLELQAQLAEQARRRGVYERHIKSLHDYNEIKDVAQELFGQLAGVQGGLTKDLYPKYGVDLND